MGWGAALDLRRPLRPSSDRKLLLQLGRPIKLHYLAAAERERVRPMRDATIAEYPVNPLNKDGLED
jgi:hypothetical protein